MSAAALELHQFPYSHYNEKARWALDWKRLPHRRHSYLPGPHAPRIKRMAGDTTTPVLVLPEAVVQGSARILEELERRHPEPALYPADPALRARALEIQRWLDEDVGPAVRRALFSILIPEPGYLCRMFAGTRSVPVRVLYRAGFPLARTMMRRSMGVDDPVAVGAAFDKTREALDFVAEHGGADRPLVGDAFSVADLTAASLLSPAVNPPHPDVSRPEPMPEALRAWNARWADHPGTRWVLAQYRLHRPPSSALA